MLFNASQSEEWFNKRKSMMLPITERDRRYKKVRELMVKQGIDCLVVCALGLSPFHEGNVRYLIGDTFKNQSHDEYVIFPLEGEPTFVLSYGFRAPWARRNTWIKNIKAPADVRGKDMKVLPIIDPIKELGYEKGTIGICRDIMPVYAYQMLVDGLPEARFVDCSTLLLEARRVKSEVEIRLAEESARIADMAFDRCKEILREGILEHQLVAEEEHILRANGCEKVYEIVVSDRVSVACATWPIIPKIIKRGETTLTEISPCFGGYWTQILRAYSIGKPDPKIEEMFKVTSEAHIAGTEYLKPGNTVGKVAEVIENIITSNGYKILVRAGHASIGLDLLETPLRPSDKTILEPGMIMVIHPSASVLDYSIGKPAIGGPGDTYVITKEGHRRLNKAPQELVYID